jgi:hypothetical protein
MSDSSIALKPVIDEPSGALDLARRDREALQVALQVGEPEEDVLAALVADLLEDAPSRRGIRRRPVLALDHRHTSENLPWKMQKDPGRAGAQACRPRPRRLR